MIDFDKRISKAEEPDDPLCKSFKKITPKSILIGTGRLQIKNIRGEPHFIHFLTESKCFCYIKDHDEKENAIVGNHVMVDKTSNCIINIPKGKLAVILGLDNYIVVE